MTSSSSQTKTVFWHRDLPPLEAELLGEHIVEAVSSRVPGTLAHRDEIWDRCYAELMAAAHARLNQEIARLGGHFAHVLHESAVQPRFASGVVVPAVDRFVEHMR